MATNIFVYWSDGLAGRAFDHHSRNGGWGICQQKLPAFDHFFEWPGDARGWNWLAHNIQLDTVYVDLAKAFESVDHPTLLRKLSACGIQGSLLYGSTLAS